MKNSWTELDLAVLRRNLQKVREALRPKTEIIFVVKANAYGHGMIPVLQNARDFGIKWFAVADLREAQTVRELLPDAGVMIVGVIEPDDVVDAATGNFLPILVSESHAAGLAEAARAGGVVLRCHAKIDTGMGRLGFPWEQAPALLPRLAGLRGLDLCGICTHFASSDSSDKSFAESQAERFHAVIRQCEQAGMTLAFKHISNSGAVLCRRGWDMDGVRPGILLYGYAARPPANGTQPPPPLKDGCVEVDTQPFLQWKTRIVQIKPVPAGFPVSYDSTYVTPHETRIAVINVGYADGFSRLLSNNGFVLAGGRRCAVAGRVTMNLTMIDLGPDTTAKEGDEVVMIGRQGPESIWADEMARWCGTIPYEILTGIRTKIHPRLV